MTTTAQGWAAATLDEMGEGPGFRKVRKELGVEAFGVNAIVMPPGIETGVHYHDEQGAPPTRVRRASSNRASPPPRPGPRSHA